MLIFLLKRGISSPFFQCYLALFFIIPGLLCASDKPEQALFEGSAELSNDPVWRALLHFDKSGFHIQDPDFLLSWPNTTLESELQATFQAFKSPVQPNKLHALCKFPARLLWFTTKLQLAKQMFPSVDCQGYREYQSKAPASDIKLVFASENVSSPSSMMGHAFLKLEGINDDGDFVEHGVTYYTILDSLNLPKLLIESLVTGMPGLFALTPYKKQKARYLHGEERNIWEYGLNLSEYDKAMIHAHIWELKGKESDYFFDTYNCATVTYFLLATAKPEIFNSNRSWISPIDVVKDANDFGLVKKGKMIPSMRWKIRMLIDQMNSDNVSDVYVAVSNKELIQGYNDIDTDQRLLSLELYKTYVDYLESNHKLDKIESAALQKNIDLMYEPAFMDIELDISKYKAPIKTPGDTQWSAGIGTIESESFLELDFLPTSHRLQDDNRQYFTENALKLGEIKLRYLAKKQSLEIHEINLYSVTSINPWDKFTGGLSLQWKIGIEPHYDRQLESHHAFNFDAGLGKAWSIHYDLMFYGMFSGGYGYGDRQHYIYLKPEIGMVVNELFDMKTIVRTRYLYNQFGSSNGYWDIELNQSWFASKQDGISLNGRLIRNNNRDELTMSLAYTRYL